jgi:hypothetical protein
MLINVNVYTIHKHLQAMFIQIKKTSAETFYHCAYAWQPLVDELRTFL